MSVDLRELAIDRGGTAAPRVRHRRHLLTRYALPAVLVLGFLSLVGWACRDLVFPPLEVTVVPVVSTTAEVHQAGEPLFQAAGWIEPRPTPVRVAALAPGVVEELLVVEDQLVQAGEPIAELVQEDARLALERAQADFELQQAELQQAKAALVAAQTRLKHPVHLEAALGESEAALAKLQTELANLPFALRRAEAEHKALQKDYEAKVAVVEGAVAGIEIDIARGKADAAAALVEELGGRSESLTREQTALVQQRDALRKQLRLLTDEIKARDQARATVDAATARVDLARVAVAEAKLRLQRMMIRAPVDGRIYRLIAEPGARIGSSMAHTPGSDGSTVVTMYRPERLQLRVDVRFEDIPRITPGQPVRINNAALAEPLAGSVLFVGSEADIQKNTLEVKVAITDPPPVLKPQMLVDVTFLSPSTSRSAEPTRTRRLYVPEPLIREGDDGRFVWLADQSLGIARRQPIETGVRTAEGLVEVTGGLTASSRLITSGSGQLAAGERIRVTGEDPVIGRAPGGEEGGSRIEDRG